MKTHLGAFAGIGLLLATNTIQADETLPYLKVGSQVYSNVTVTEVTATDIYFNHAQGMGNAKLKLLAPDLQKHFHYDAAKAGEIEKQQKEANAQYRAKLAAAKPKPRPTAPDTDDDVNIVGTKLYARSFLGKRLPPVFLNQWLNPRPEVEGKFMMIVFWATWSKPCRQAIPHLNDLYAEYKDRLVIIGLSNESPGDALKMTSPRVEFPLAIDRQSRTLAEVGVKAIPHAVLVDPHGIVRFEGIPSRLTETGLGNLLDRYSK